MNLLRNVIVIAAIALFVIIAPAKSEDASRTQEAAEAAAEDEAESKLPEADQILALKTVSGQLSLMSGDEGSDVVGILTQSDGKSYILKLAAKELMKQLSTYNNKSVTLKGKLRNKEKYLVVSAIADPGGAAPAERTKRGGI